MKTLIRGARLLDPAHGIDMVGDVLIDGGRVAQVDAEIEAGDASVVEACGKLLVPGLVDIHTHLREPGREHKETILTGARAAAAGGFTAICAMPNTMPVMDSTEVLSFFAKQADNAPVRCFPISAITVGLKGAQLTDPSQLISQGAVAFSDDGEPVRNSAQLLESLRKAEEHRRPLILHCEDKDLAGRGAMHLGYRSRLLGLQGIPGAAEDAMTGRDLAIAASSSAPVHIAHVSTAVSLELIRQAKASGVRVTCEVTPHHLTLTHDCVEAADSNTKMNPPLRTREDMEALRQGLLDGTIDCIATDHAPHHVDEKALPYSEAPFGIVGLETALPVLLTELVQPGILSLRSLVRLMTSAPAAILGLPCGALIPGGRADLTLIDLAETRTVKPEAFYSKGRNTPYAGRRLSGWPAMTMVQGKIVMKDGVVYA